MPADLILNVRDHPSTATALRMIDGSGYLALILAATEVCNARPGRPQEQAIDGLREVLKAAGRSK